MVRKKANNKTIHVQVQAIKQRAQDLSFRTKLKIWLSMINKDKKNNCRQIPRRKYILFV